MAEFKTNCECVGQPEIVLTVADEARMELRWIVDYFHDAIVKGKRFRSGETVQIGWMITKLTENVEGDLEVWEPQFRSVPIQWVRGINNTLRHLILQKSVAELFNIDPVFPSILQAGTIFPPVWEHQGQLYLHREAPLKNDSGWRISRDGNAQNGGQFRSLFEIGCKFPSLVPFLALPGGASVVCSARLLSLDYRGAMLSSNDTKLLKDIQSIGVIWN